MYEKHAHTCVRKVVTKMRWRLDRVSNLQACILTNMLVLRGIWTHVFEIQSSKTRVLTHKNKAPKAIQRKHSDSIEKAITHNTSSKTKSNRIRKMTRFNMQALNQPNKSKDHQGPIKFSRKNTQQAIK